MVFIITLLKNEKEVLWGNTQQNILNSSFISGAHVKNPTCHLECPDLVLLFTRHDFCLCRLQLPCSNSTSLKWCWMLSPWQTLCWRKASPWFQVLRDLKSAFNDKCVFKLQFFNSKCVTPLNSDYFVIRFNLICILISWLWKSSVKLRWTVQREKHEEESNSIMMHHSGNDCIMIQPFCDALYTVGQSSMIWHNFCLTEK